MGNDVLTDKDREVLFQLKHNQFAGHIPADRRARFEKAFEMKYSKRPNVCWTCSGSIKQLAKQIL
jgi:hypothetical protein